MGGEVVLTRSEDVTIWVTKNRSRMDWIVLNYVWREEGHGRRELEVLRFRKTKRRMERQTE